jgi:hypothetical protein
MYKANQIVQKGMKKGLPVEMTGNTSPSSELQSECKIFEGTK